MPRAAGRGDMVDRVRSLEEQVRRLRIRKPIGSGGAGEYFDLIPNLDYYDEGTQTGWEGFNFGQGETFGAHLTGGRCYLVGGLHFLDFVGGWGTSPLAIPLPAELRPDPTLVNICMKVDGENSPTEYAGASAEADVTTDGLITFENFRIGGGIGGWYDHSITAEDAPGGGTEYSKWHQAGVNWRPPYPFGVPHDTYLVCDGISWKVA